MTQLQLAGTKHIDDLLEAISNEFGFNVDDAIGSKARYENLGDFQTNTFILVGDNDLETEVCFIVGDIVEGGDF